MSTLPIAFDDGTSAHVPMNKVPAALKDGGQLVQAMRFNDGSSAFVPMGRVAEAMRDGGMVIGEMPGRPQVSMQPVADLNPVHFANRAAGRVEQNLNNLADVPAEAQREINQAVTSPHSAHALITNTASAVYGALTKAWHDYHDPANIAGDVATAALGGAVTEGADVAPEAAAATKAAPAELPLVGKLVRAYDFVKNLGDGAHPPELAPVLDGLNELSQGVLERIQKAKAAGLSDVAPPAATESAPASRLMGIPKQVRSFADVRDDQVYQDYANADLENQGMVGRLQVGREFRAGNDASTPKWRLLLDQKIDQLIQQAEAKQTSSPQVKPLAPLTGAPKAKAAAAVAGAGDDDLTEILKASLDLARKKKGPQ